MRTVGIDARLRPGLSGGLEQFIVGLAHGLSGLTDGPERYRFLCLPGGEGWLLPYLSGPCELAERRAVAVPASETPRLSGLPHSDGTFESLDAGIVHFPRQDAFVTELPSIFQPWDLQHLHHPKFFDPDAVAKRELRYRAFCARASSVVVASRWGKRDLVEQYGLNPARVAVIPVPAPTSAYPQDLETAPAVDLPDRFVLYPAQTWEHKNHVRLLEALAWLRDDRGLVVDLVCTGRQNEHFPVIAGAVERLALAGQVWFLGFIGTDEMQHVYRKARAMVFPSLFEGWGLPVMEAMSMGLPLACSRVTSLPDMVGDAALLFDPTNVHDIASALERLWTDADLRHRLAERGTQRASGLTWEKTARTYRALYRSTAGWPLEPSDLEALARIS